MIFKKMGIISTALAVLSAVMTGCGGVPSETAQAETSEVSVVESTAAADPHTEMVNRSFVQLGNTYRLNKKIEQMKSGADTTIAYIGGSITVGYTVNPDECFAKLSYDYLAEKFGTGENVKYVNAGISGTPSILGNLRLQRDVLSENADIIFVEFAVNDGSEQLFKESYDSLVKTALEQPNEPAVILIFTITQEGHTAQDYMKEIGSWYDLPMISVADAVKPEVDSGRMAWGDYSNDDCHPNPQGHKLVTEFISNYFTQLEAAEPSEGYTLPEAGKHGAPYENAVLAEADYDNSNPDLQITEVGCFNGAPQGFDHFSKGWAYKNTSEGDGAFKFNVDASSLFIIFRRNNSSAMGKAEVFINGQRAAVVNTNDKDGWGEAYAYKIIKWGGIKEMEVEVRPAEDNGDKTIEILGIAYSKVSEG